MSQARDGLKATTCGDTVWPHSPDSRPGLHTPALLDFGLGMVLACRAHLNARDAAAQL